MNLSEQAKQAILNDVTAALRVMLLEGGFGTTKGNALQCVAKVAKQAHKYGDPWLSQSDGFTIVFSEIADYVSDLEPDYTKRSEISGQFLDVVGKAGVDLVADRIVTFIESIPRTYEFYFPLAGVTLDEDPKDIQVTPSVRIGERRDDAPGGLLGAMFDNASPYIIITSKGFDSYSGGSSAVVSAFSTLKRFCYAATILGLIRQDTLPTPAFSMEPIIVKNYEVVDCGRDANAIGQRRLPMTLGSELQRLQVSDEARDLENALTPLIQSVGLCKLIEPQIHNEDQQIRSMQISTEWAFDSLAAEDDRLALMQTTIALEALLGEELDEKSPLTQALSDRCAYLLGKNYKERKNLRDGFRKLYRVRSNLVHGKRSTLQDDDIGILDWAKTVHKACLALEARNLN